MDRNMPGVNAIYINTCVVYGHHLLSLPSLVELLLIVYGYSDTSVSTASWCLEHAIYMKVLPWLSVYVLGQMMWLLAEQLWGLIKVQCSNQPFSTQCIRMRISYFLKRILNLIIILLYTTCICSQPFFTTICKPCHCYSCY